MRPVRIALYFSLFLSLSCFGEGDRTPTFLTHLLGYLAIDYPGAIGEKGERLSAGEYVEMQEFTKIIVELQQELVETRNSVELTAQVQELQRLVTAAAPPSILVPKAEAARLRVIELAKLETAPHHWPDQAHGKQGFERNCAQCHGVNGHGDGPSSGNLDPKPTDFYDPKMDSISPLQAFNSIRLGVPGTSMAAFSNFTEKEIWDLAFYVVSLRHRALVTSAEVPAVSPLPLGELASHSDTQLRKNGRGTALSQARLFSGESAAQSALDVARSRLAEAQNAFLRKDYTAAKTAAILAYLDGVEPVEPRLRARDLQATQLLEDKMAGVRGAIDARVTPEVMTERVDEAFAMIAQAEALMAAHESSAAFTFSVAAGIVLREAFEAVLIIITLLGVLRAVGATRGLLYVHGGWILAVVAGVVVWFFSGWLVALSGAHRELMEGGIAAFAVVVLLYLGFWLHRRSEIGKWRAFISDMVTAAMDRKRLLVLGGVAFMAVFREAFETVLFLRALLLEAGPRQEVPLLAGVLASFALVVILASLLVRFSVKIPIRQLFSVSSVLMVVLATVLTGKAFHSFQEAGVLSVTRFPLGVRWDLVGLYPTYETLVPQLGVLLLCVIFWVSSRADEKLTHRAI